MVHTSDAGNELKMVKRNKEAMERVPDEGGGASPTHAVRSGEKSNMRRASRRVMNDSKARFGHENHQFSQDRGI